MCIAWHVVALGVHADHTLGPAVALRGLHLGVYFRTLLIGYFHDQNTRDLGCSYFK